MPACQMSPAPPSTPRGVVMEAAMCTHRRRVVTWVGRGVSCYGAIVLRRVVVRVAVALVDGRADGRQLLGPGGCGRGVVLMARGVGMGVVVVLLMRQGDGVGGMWLRSACAKIWCLHHRGLRLVVGSLPFHSFARVAIHGRATSTGKPQRGQTSSIIGRGTRRHGFRTRATAVDTAMVIGWDGASAARKLPLAVMARCDGCWGRRRWGEGRMGTRPSLEDGGLVWRLLDHTEPSVSQLSVRFLVNKA